MKKFLFVVCTFIIPSYILFSQNSFSDVDGHCNLRNTTLKRINQESPLYPFVAKNINDGTMQFTPFVIDDIGGWEVFFSSLVSSENVTFEYIGMSDSKLFDGSYYKYQQFYKGVPVFGAGFSVLIESNEPESIIGPPCEGCPGPSDPCLSLSFISANIYEIPNANISVIPNFSENNIENQKASQNDLVESAELYILPTVHNSCDLQLAWKVNYIDDERGGMIDWINANSGALIYETVRHVHKNAPTADYGIHWLDDEVEEGETVLRNDRLAVLDFSPVFGDPGITGPQQALQLFSDSRIPVSPLTRGWNISDAPEEVFQAFWMADTILDVFETELDITLENTIKLGVHPTVQGAANLISPQVPDDEYWMVFGVFGDSVTASTVEFDIVGHEIYHAVLQSEGISPSAIWGRTIHEGLAEIFGTYAESKIESLDWIIGDNDPIIANTVLRDLANPVSDCFTDIEMETDDPYLRSEPLMHWFYLCIVGDAVEDIPAMDIDELMSIIVESLPNMGVNPDYVQLMEATSSLAEMVYGSCSDQLRTIIRAWEKICVPTGHAIANGTCTSIGGISSVCEENNYFDMCLTATSQLNLEYGRWAISGRNSTLFESYLGMQGNVQFGGDCLQITSIPTMPYYPQVVTIRYSHPAMERSIIKRVKLVDCDGDDPTCEDYYGLQPLSNSNNFNTIEEEVISIDIKSNIVPAEICDVLIYDILGNKVSVSEEQIASGFRTGEPRILIVTYWDKYGNLISTKKIISE